MPIALNAPAFQVVVGGAPAVPLRVASALAARRLLIVNFGPGRLYLGDVGVTLQTAYVIRPGMELETSAEVPLYAICLPAVVARVVTLVDWTLGNP